MILSYTEGVVPSGPAKLTPHPTRPSADGLVKTPVAGHPLPKGEGKAPA